MNADGNPDGNDCPEKGWLLHDGECPFCRKWVSRLAGTLRRTGVTALPLQSPEVRRLTPLARAELLRGITLVRPDGTTFQGPGAVRELMRHDTPLFPFYLVSIIPGIRSLFDRTYWWTARRRHQLAGGQDQSPPSSSR